MNGNIAMISNKSKSKRNNNSNNNNNNNNNNNVSLPNSQSYLQQKGYVLPVQKEFNAPLVNVRLEKHARPNFGTCYKNNCNISNNSNRRSFVIQRNNNNNNNNNIENDDAFTDLDENFDENKDQDDFGIAHFASAEEQQMLHIEKQRMKELQILDNVLTAKLRAEEKRSKEKKETELIIPNRERIKNVRESEMKKNRENAHIKMMESNAMVSRKEKEEEENDRLQLNNAVEQYLKERRLEDERIRNEELSQKKEKYHIQKLEEENKTARQNIESQRYLTAMHSKLNETIERMKIAIPPLCACGFLPLQQNGNHFARNCAFYNNPHGYYKVLTQFLLSKGISINISSNSNWH